METLIPTVTRNAHSTSNPILDNQTRMAQIEVSRAPLRLCVPVTGLMLPSQALIEKRTMNFDYLRKMHKSDAFWLNCVQITKEKLSTFIVTEVSPGRDAGFRLIWPEVSVPWLLGAAIEAPTIFLLRS
jgi:hypothetical protein